MSSPALVPFDPATMIQTLDPQGRGLRVAFYQQGDRYGHVVATVVKASTGQEVVTPLLVSKEGTASESWPPSPPLQSLSIEQRATGAVALLVGMAGSSHWSMSVEAHAESGQMKFDVACRAASSTDWLGSIYRLVDKESLGHVRIRSTLGRLGDGAAEEIVLQPDTSVATKSPSRRWAYVIERFR